MARLTGFSRFLIVLAIVAGLFFLAKKFLPQLGGGSATAPATEMPGGQTSGATAPPPSTGQPTGWTSDNAGSGAGTGASAEAGRPFSFNAPAPVNGRLKGVVELGSTGFNSFIVKIDAQKNWKLEKSQFEESLVYEKLATEDDIKTGLKKFIASMLAYGVGSRDIHFVISSGAAKVDITNKIREHLKTIGYVCNDVTPEQEARYALKSAQPAAFEGKAFVVDIGSGNTKIAYSRGGSIATFEAAGSKYYQNNMTDEAAYQDIKAKTANIPAGQRETCFIIGGVPFELARQSRNGKERYTVLKGPGGYTADGAKQKAGLNIYKAVADATGCKQFVFDWEANFTIGFLLGL